MKLISKIENLETTDAFRQDSMAGCKINKIRMVIARLQCELNKKTNF